MNSFYRKPQIGTWCDSVESLALKPACSSPVVPVLQTSKPSSSPIVSSSENWHVPPPPPHLPFQFLKNLQNVPVVSIYVIEKWPLICKMGPFVENLSRTCN